MFERSDSLTTNSHKLNYIGKSEMRYIYTYVRCPKAAMNYWDIRLLVANKFY